MKTSRKFGIRLKILLLVVPMVVCGFTASGVISLLSSRRNVVDLSSQLMQYKVTQLENYARGQWSNLEQSGFSDNPTYRKIVDDSIGSFAQGMESRWNLKLNGMVELPAGFHLAGTLNARDGYIFQRVYWVAQRSGGIGDGRVFLQPLGDSRHDDLWLVDFRVDKTFDIGRSRLSVLFDVFNLLNSATILAREPRQNVPSANRIYDILSPRVIRLGARWAF